MAEITVCIEIDDQGQISVGMEPQESEDAGAQGSAPSQQGGQMTNLADIPAGDEEDAEKSYMQPAKSIDQALSMARDMLMQASGQGPEVEQGAADDAFKARRGAKSPMGM